jgi:hypothetical protein
VIEKPVIYGGLLFHHFGHTIAESIHRLWPRFASKSLGAAVNAAQAESIKETAALLRSYGMTAKEKAQTDRVYVFED